MSEPSRSSSQPWRPEPQRPSEASRHLWVILVAAALLAVIGALIAWLCIPDPFPTPDLVALAVGEYDEEFPVRPWVRQDAEALCDLPWGEHNNFTSQKRDLLWDEVEALRHRRPIKTPVVVYLSAYVRPNSEGELCVLPADARLDRPGSWLRLGNLLKDLCQCPAPRKMLLLDVMQPCTDARQGLLTNDAAERLERLLDEDAFRDSHLSVLCACSPGQVSLASEELGHTVFGHFLHKALRGETGKDLQRPHGGRISALDLSAYVIDRVDQWAVHNRGVRQTPRLLGAKDDFPLLGADPDAKAAEAADVGYPPWLSDTWQQRDQWWQEESLRQNPELLLSLEETLIHAERQWRGGVERTQGDLDSRLAYLRQRHNQERPRSDSGGHESLAQAVQRGNLPSHADPEAVHEIRRLAGRYAQSKEAKADDPSLKKATEDLVKKFARPEELAQAVFEAAAGDPLAYEGLQYLSGLLERPGAASCEEIHYLQRLAGLPAKNWHAESVCVALQTIEQAEKAATIEPRALPWVRESQGRALDLRKEGENLLFGADPAGPERAYEPLSQALQAYRLLNRVADTITQAQHCCDEALVLLPGYEAYLEIDDRTELTWGRTMAAACRLCELLGRAGASRTAGSARPTGRLAPVVEIEHAQDEVLAGLALLPGYDPEGMKKQHQPLGTNYIQTVIGRRVSPGPADLKVMAALLETPWPRAAQRAQLWSARHERALQLQEKGPATQDLPPLDAKAAIDAERRRALGRARRSIIVLRLLGAEDVEKLEQYRLTAEKGTNSAALPTLSEELRQAWRRQRSRVQTPGSP